jgi:hypothetical protein
MAEIADEELSEVIPVAVEKISNNFKDIGYYIDENGHKKFGVIPNKNYNTPVKTNIDTG